MKKNKFCVSDGQYQYRNNMYDPANYENMHRIAGGENFLKCHFCTNINTTLHLQGFKNSYLISCPKKLIHFKTTLVPEC